MSIQFDPIWVVGTTKMRRTGKKFRATLMQQDRYGRMLNSVLFTGHNHLLTALRTSICRTNPMTIFLKLNQFLQSYDPNEILKKAEDILGSKIADYKKARRLREHECEKEILSYGCYGGQEATPIDSLGNI